MSANRLPSVSRGGMPSPKRLGAVREGRHDAAVIWLAFVAIFVLVVVAIIVFAMDVVPFQREDLRVGVLSPHVTARIAMGKRNRTLAIALVTFVTAGCGP